MSGRPLNRRLEKLEAVLNILSTDKKGAIVHDRTLRLLSNGDLEVIASMEGAGSAVDPPAEHVALMARFDDAFWTAMGAANIHFTVLEMDQLLAGAIEAGKKYLPIFPLNVALVRPNDAFEGERIEILGY